MLAFKWLPTLDEMNNYIYSDAIFFVSVHVSVYFYLLIKTKSYDFHKVPWKFRNLTI
jgi:hypothetical protein